tara:strand:+ start:2151 stop:3224 length:1074 start_codon:yes stop_codon:yes gene_type:complete
VTKKETKTVYVAMSGGVDSSLSASLLKEASFNVVGVFIKTWHPPFLECPWKEDRLDALRVATHLNIPFKTINLSKEYKKEVIDYLLSEYKKGKTPNPDVMCNKTIKFGAFFKWARKEGADYVATGHYAQVKEKGGMYCLYQGKDDNKDQTYFLWNLQQKHLKHTLFPIGHLEKSAVRREAEKRGLVTARKKDSQGLCFVGKINFKKFLKRYIKTKKGNVLNLKKEVIGWHEGAVFYTIGERHGFTVTKKTPNDTPYYIVDKNIKKNELIVAEKKDIEESAVKEVSLGDTNWTEGKTPALNEEYSARSRYRQKFVKGILKKKGSKYYVQFKKPQTGIARGQSLVLYKGKECLGGGVIG